MELDLDRVIVAAGGRIEHWRSRVGGGVGPKFNGDEPELPDGIKLREFEW